MSQVIGSWTFVDDNPYGITHGIFSPSSHITPQLVTDMVAMGVSRLRIQLSAILIETASGVYDPVALGTLDDIIQQCNVAGIRVSFPIRELSPKGGGTCWASESAPCESGSTYYYGKIANFVNFAVYIAKRYSGDGGSYNATNGSGKSLIVDCLEIGNEDYDVHGTKGGPGRNPMRYVQYAREMAAAMRKPVSQGGGGWTRRIGAWGCWEQDQAHILNVLATLHSPPSDPVYNPTGDSSSVISILDYMNFHNYQAAPDTLSVTPYSLKQEIQDIRNFLDTHGYSATPVWCTEFGADGPVAGVSGTVQANYFNSGGTGALDAARTSRAQHVDIYNMSYSGTLSNGYTGDPKAVATYDSNTSSFVRFPAFTTIQSYITSFPGSVANPWPYPFGTGTTGQGSPLPGVAPTSLSFAGLAGTSDPMPQTVVFTNVGNAAGDWNASIALNNGTNWLSITPLSGAGLAAGGSQNITVTASNITGVLAAGTYTAVITFTMGGTSVTTDVTLTVTAPSGGGTGLLTGVVGVSPPSLNFTTLAPTDWAHYGLAGVTSFDHKATGGSLISAATTIGSMAATQQVNAGVAYSWSDGTPTGTANGSITGISVTGVGNGFRITVPASATVQTLNVYLDVFQGQGEIVAHLSDNSAVDYTDTTLQATTGTDSGVYTFTYQAASSGQTLTITYTLLNGTTLTGGTVVDSDNFTRANNPTSWNIATGGGGGGGSTAAPNVMLVLMENRAYSDVIGNTSVWPHVNTLATTYGNATNYYGTDHPSLPNYLALASGSNQGVSTDTATGPFSGNTLFDSMTAAGISWKGYLESMPSVGYTGPDTGLYYKHHSPFPYFSTILNSNEINNTVPYTQLTSDLASSNPPTFMWVSPNINDDGHNTTDTTADTFINKLVTQMQATSWYTKGNGILIFVWDEGLKGDKTGIGDGPGGGHTCCIVVSAASKGVAPLTTSVNHYGLLKAIEKLYNLPQLQNSAHTTNGDLTPLFGVLPPGINSVIAPASSTSAPLLPGETLTNGVSNLIWGINTPNYNTNLTDNAGVAPQLAKVPFPVIRCSINTSAGVNYTDAQLDALMLAVSNASAVPLVILRYSDLVFSLHAVTYLGNRCMLYEFSNEPDINGISVTQYTTAWNSLIPQCRAVNPNAAYIGPVLGVYANVSSYLLPWLSNCVSSGVMPDGISYHDYPCTSTSAIPQATCSTNAPTIGSAGATLRTQVFNLIGRNLPICCTEWNIDAYYSGSNAQSYSTNIAANASFITSFTTAALKGFADNNIDMACEFELNYYLVDDSNPGVTSEPQYNAMAASYASYIGSGNSGGTEVWQQNTAGSGATTSLVSNQGLVNGTAGSYTVGLLNTKTIQNPSATVTTLMSASLDAAGPVLRSTTNAAQYYRASLHGGNFQIVYTTAGVDTILATQAAAYSVNTAYNIAFQCSGTTLSASWWLTGGTQPTTWMLTVVDTKLQSAGQYGVRAFISGASDTVTFDTFSVIDLDVGGTLPAYASLQAATLGITSTPPPPPNSTLTGSFTTPTGTINLTTEGTGDWQKWGDYTTLSSADRKANVSQVISPYIQVGTAMLSQGTAALLGYSWTDGTPGATGTAVTTELDCPGVNNGFQFSVPLTPLQKTLNVYVGVNNAQGQFTATLNDGSGLAYVDATLNSTGSAVRKYTLVYSGGATASTMTIQWTMLADNGTGSSGSSTLATDTFVRANQSGSWGTASDGVAVWSIISGVAVISIASNAGKVTSTTGSPIQIMQCGTGTGLNVEGLITFNSTDTTSSAGIVLRQTAASTHYRSVFSNGVFYITKSISGTQTDLTTTPFTLATGKNYSIRFRANGSSLLARMWLSSDPEPTAWTLSATDSSISTAGNYGTRTRISPSGNTVLYSEFSMTSITTVVTAGTVALEAATLVAPVTAPEHIYVPAYAYPTDPGGTGTTWAQYEASAPAVSLVTINPANGPGNSADSNYIAGIIAMQAENISVLGYVNTSTAGTLATLASVEAQIDSWYSFYPMIDGIAFDNVLATSGNLAFYTSLYTYVRGKDPIDNYVLHIIGSVPPSTYMNVLDTAIIYQDVYANIGSFATQSYMGTVSNTKFAAIVQNVTTPAQVDTVFTTFKAANVGFLYCTNLSGASSYLSPPATTVWNEEVLDCGTTATFGQLSASSPAFSESGNGFTDGNTTETLTLSNIPATNGSTITWKAQSDTPGTIFTPSSGTLAEGASSLLTISYPPSLAAPAVVTITLVATSNSVSIPWNAPSPSSPLNTIASVANLGIYKQQQVYVFTPSGTFLGIWQDAPLLAGFKESINGATTPLKVTLPRSFDNFDQVGAVNSRGTVAQGNIVQYWLYGPGLPTSGLLRYQGVIDTYQPQIDQQGAETVTVTITPFDSVLGDRGVTADAGVVFGTAGNSATYVDPVTMFNYFFTNTDSITGLPFLAPMTADPNNPTSSSTTAQFSFLRETMLDVFTTLLFLLPSNWFFRTNPNKTITLNVAPAAAQHTFYIGQNIVNPSYTQDWMTLRNVIVLKAGIINSVQAYQKAVGTDLAIFGERLMLIDESRITDANSAIVLTQGYLNFFDRATLRAVVRVPDYRGDANAGLGYDIETLHVGDTVQILDALTSTNIRGSLWDQSTWDKDYWDFSPGDALNQVVQIQSVTYNFDYVDLELGLFQPSQDRQLFLLQQRLQKYALA